MILCIVDAGDGKMARMQMKSIVCAVPPLLIEDGDADNPRWLKFVRDLLCELNNHESAVQTLSQIDLLFVQEMQDLKRERGESLGMFARRLLDLYELHEFLRGEVSPHDFW